MIKRSYFLVFVCILLPIVLFNCSDQEAVPPSYDFDDQLANLDLPVIVLDAPANASSVPGGIKESDRAEGLYLLLDGLKTKGAVPSEVVRISNAVKEVLSQEEISSLSALTVSEIEIASNSGELPAYLEGTISKIRNTPLLRMYCVSYTLPSVGKAETYIPLAYEQVDRGLGINGSKNNCMQQALTALDNVLKKLDTSREKELAKVKSAYDNYLSLAIKNEATCQSTIAKDFDSALERYQKKHNKLLNSLGESNSVLGNHQAPIVALLKGLMLDYSNTVNVLKKAELNSCSLKGEIARANAEVNQKTNIDKVEAAFAAGLLEAKAKLMEMYNNCHNQGGGQ